MGFKPVLLWTDILLFILVLATIAVVFFSVRRADVRAAWRSVFQRRLALVSLCLLAVFILIGLLDSLHFRPQLPAHNGAASQHYAATTKSVLDKLLAPLGQVHEKTYSAPFALTSFMKETVEMPGGEVKRFYPRLQHAAQSVSTPAERTRDILKRFATAFVIGAFFALVLLAGFVRVFVWRYDCAWLQAFRHFWTDTVPIPWRVLWVTLSIILWIGVTLWLLSSEYHILGTDKVGQDVFYLTIKSIRTGLIIGTLTTLIMLPFAIALGIGAGFFGGLVDDVIQYLYTTLSSIPGVLLIAAAILSLQVFISNHAELFETLTERADARLLALCVILGVTSWTGLCRLLRAETLKLREIDFIQAAKALGTSSAKTLRKHLLPNVMHIVLIAVVLDFSTLVLAEAVLSYVGVGVDPTAISWGNMINSARLELAREPVVWWPLLAAFIFMFILVLSANLFADAVRDGFDPRTRGA